MPVQVVYKNAPQEGGIGVSDASPPHAEDGSDLPSGGALESAVLFEDDRVLVLNVGKAMQQEQQKAVDECICPECGTIAPHELGNPCVEKACPECGAMMVGHVAKSTDLEEDIRQIRDAFYEQHRTPSPVVETREGFWVQRVLDDALIVEQADGLYRYSYSTTESGVVFGTPEKVELEYKPVAKQVQFLKADDEKRLVYGVVMEPDEVDTQGDTANSEEIELACHRFMLDRQRLDLEHQREVEKSEAAIVECYIAPQAMQFPGGNVKAGSWLMVTKIYSDEMWADVKSGELGGYSIRGRGVRTRRSE